VPRELSGDFGKRRVGFAHTAQYADGVLHRRASVNKPIRFVAPEQDCRDSAPRFYR
jgi:hypothetical protein